MKKFLLAVGVALMAMSANAENWFISGAFQGWNHAAAEYQFTDKGNGVFELALNETFEGEFTILQGEVGTPDWENKIGSNGDDVVANEDYYYVPGGGNFMMDGSVENAVITINTVEGYLLVTGEAQANEYETIYMVGNIDGVAWDPNTTAYPLTPNADKTQFTGVLDVTVETAYLVFKAGAVNYGGTMEGQENVDIAGPSNDALELRKGGQTYAVPEGKYAVTINLPYNGETGTVVFAADNSAISGVEADSNVAPVYYNLQGVRVDNAANGLYIVVRGDKAAKEFVR